MEHPQPVHVEQAPPPCARLAVERRPDPGGVPPDAAEGPGRCRKRSLRRSAVTRGKVRLAITPPSRERRWSAASREISRPKASHTSPRRPATPDSASTRNFSPYWVATPQIAAAKPASRIAECKNGRSRT